MQAVGNGGGWDPRLREAPSLTGAGREVPPGPGGEIVPKETHGGDCSQAPPHADTSSGRRGVLSDAHDSVEPILALGLCHADSQLVHPPPSITLQESPASGISALSLTSSLC